MRPVADTTSADRPWPLSRRGFLGAATAGTVCAGAAHAGTSAARAPAGPPGLRLTEATNGAATLPPPGGGPLVAEVQGVLWAVPDDGGEAVALTRPDLEPCRPVHSPDGSRLAVCAYRDGGFHLWTLAADGSRLRQLTHGPWDDRAPAWSPDGTRLAFCSERDGDPVRGGAYRIWVADTADGRLTRLTGSPDPARKTKGPKEAGEAEGPKEPEGPGRAEEPEGAGGTEQGGWEDFDPVWSSDGTRVVFVRGRATAAGTLDARVIASVEVPGPGRPGPGPVTVVHTAEAGGSVLTPALSARGRLAYLRTTPAPAAGCTLVVDGRTVPVTGDIAPAPPRWVGEDSLLLTVDGGFRTVHAGTGRTVRRVPFTATLPAPPPRRRPAARDRQPTGPRPVRGVHLPSLSPDGRSVAFGALGGLWTAPTSGGGAPRRVVRAAPTHYPQGPRWSADGRSLLYADDRDGLFAVRRRELATGAEEVLAEGGRVFPAPSPDGRRLACLDLAGRLLVVDPVRGTERVLVTAMGGGGLPGAPSWSPDGRYLAFCDRGRLSLRFREGYNLVRIVGADDGSDRLYSVAPHTSISDRYGCGPVWSPDGRHFAYVAESALWLLPVRPDGAPDGEPRQLTGEAADHPSWSADSRRLLYLCDGLLRTVSVSGDGAVTEGPRTVPVPLSYRSRPGADAVVHAGRLWDGTGGPVREDVDITVRGGRVVSVAPHRAGGPARSGRRIDASEQTVVPGLWDAHVHPYTSTYGGRQSALQLAYGITTAVSMGGSAYEQARMREAVASGEMTGPRLLTTGELLDGGRVAYSMGRAHRTPEGLERSLGRGVALEWDFVKTYVRAPGWMMAQAARFAHDRLGVPCGSHLCTPGVAAGQDLTTHLQATQRQEYGRATTANGFAYQDVIGLYARTGFHLVATPFTAAPLVGDDPGLAGDVRVGALMPPWDVAPLRERAARPPSAAQRATLAREVGVYRRVLDGGGVVALGTDQPLVPVGLHLHLALRALHQHGFSPAEALRTATVLPARVFGADRDLGTVEEGKIADLTFVDGDPFTDFASMVRTSAVVRGGRVLYQSDLVAAFAPVAARSARLGSAQYWSAVGSALRQGGCCG
ncbi:amidohydrolase family protein [Streptomyces sp. NPDC051567]|uniref:amidohydrolase family protein n=1 Tax=Streptomyces sp. NPDC051567 TaxID=3365660 RepID=UPI0037ADAAB0